MSITNLLSTSLLLGIAAGCASTASPRSGHGAPWSAHEDVSRAYHSACVLSADARGDRWASHEDTSRTYDRCCPLIPDAPDARWLAHEDLSRTYRTCCPMVPDSSGGEGVHAAPASGECAGPKAGGSCEHCK